MLSRKCVSDIAKFSLKYDFCQNDHLKTNKLLTFTKCITSNELYLSHLTANLMEYLIKLYQNYYSNKNNLWRFFLEIEIFIAYNRYLDRNFHNILFHFKQCFS